MPGASTTYADERTAALKKVEKFYHEPFHIVGPIYFVVNKCVSAYPIYTGEGLVLMIQRVKETV